MQKMILKLICALLIGAVSVPTWAMDPAPSDPQQSHICAGGVRNLEDRVKQLEETIQQTPQSSRWFDRIKISGRVEFEAGYQKIDYLDSHQEDEKNSNADLAAAELVFDVKIATHVDSHIMLNYENDDVFVNEGFITINGSDAFPIYLIAGRQFIPFGNFDSHFVTDPNTLLLGETNEGAVVVGYRLGGNTVDISVGAFNGDANEAGDDDTIDSLVAGITVQPLDTVLCGVSYTSNLVGSDALNEVLIDPDHLDSLIAGWNVFASFQFLERFKLTGEYLSALGNLMAGELYDASDGKARQPSAWNLEFGITLVDNLEVAARYGGSEDGGEFLPESQYGVVVNWRVLKNTNLAIEYLHDAFEDNDQDTDSCVVQLAIEF